MTRQATSEPAAVYQTQFSPPIGSQPQRAQAAPAGGRYKVGSPYQSGGVWYVPAEQPGYEETGLASWYGDAFNGKPTANGELFDMYGVSGAHATLPMPSIVEVTNLENGRVLQVRMNDRGPFHPGRIIDLSRGAADKLGFAVKGTAKVRVRYVGPASLNGVDARMTFASNSAPVREYLPERRPVAYQTVAPVRSNPAPHIEVMNVPAGVSGGGAYAVQAGAYGSREAAERIATSLASAGSTTIRPLDRGGAILFRVVVGPWGDQSAAQSARERVAALGFNDARIVPGF